VWAAYDETLGVDVAVKEIWLPPAGSDEEHRERVVRATHEARNAAKLRDHPHIVAVHDVVVEDGVPWTVMRLVDGCSLEERLRADGPLPAPRVAEVAGALLKALGAAHAMGIVHRDVKPANVMLARDGQVLLTDFGISVHQADTALTSTGGVIGSAEYMAPERLNGVDEAAGDLFSLGATLYQAVEGVSPFRRETPTATLAAVALTQAPSPERAGALAPLITRLMAKEPGDRPTAEAALDVLGGGGPTAVITQEVPPVSPDPAPPASRSPSGLKGASSGGEQPVASPTTATATLTVTNRSGAPFHVIVDDVGLGTVDDGGQGTFKAEPGMHNVWIRAGQYRCEAKAIQVRRNSTVHLLALARVRGGHVILGAKPAMSRIAGLVVGLIGLVLSLTTLIFDVLIHLDTLAGDNTFGVSNGEEVGAAVTASVLFYAVGSYMLQIGFRAARNRPESFRSAATVSLLLAGLCAALMLGLWMPLV
jgi:protein kinase-like protein